jgi:hypothetical protein
MAATWAGTAWYAYNLTATLSARRFAATYRRHVAMLGVFLMLVLTATAMLVRVASVSGGGDEGSSGLEDAITPGGLAAAAFVLLLARALVDAHRAVLRDRALWTALVSPADEGALRTGMMLRGVVMQLGLVTAVLSLVTLVLATSPDPFNVPPETGPLIALSGLASGALALPLLATAMAFRREAARTAAAPAALLSLAGLFMAALQLGWPAWAQLASGIAVVALAAFASARAPAALAAAWESANRPREARSRGPSPTGPLLQVVEAGMGPVGRSLVRREVRLALPPRQRLSVVALNLAMCGALVTLDLQLRQLVADGSLAPYYYHWVVGPFLVAVGLYAVGFFQVTAPLLDAFTKEGPALWVLKTSPAEPRTIVRSKVRPLLAFLPVTLLAVGLATPLSAGRGPVALAVAALGTVGVYLAFAGVGAWAGAAYPNIDRHSNAPPDLVLAFNMMVACLVVEALVLLPVLAVDPSRPVWSLAVMCVSVLIGATVYNIGIGSGARALGRLQLAS